MGGDGSGRRPKRWNKGYGNGRPKLSHEDEELALKMRLEEKKSLGQIAAHFGVSRSAMGQKFKKFDSYIKNREIVEKHGLTKEEGEFCKKLVNGHNCGTAMSAIRPDLTPNSAEDAGRRMHKRDDIRAAIRDMMELKGIGLERRIDKLKEHIESKNAQLSLKALDQSWRIDGTMITETRTEQTINVGILDLSAYALKTVESKEV